MVELTIKTTEYKYIAIGENQIPYIAGSTMKVVELITRRPTRLCEAAYRTAASASA